MLEAYDFLDWFTIHEVACLALGVDPAVEMVPTDLKGVYSIIVRAATTAAQAGNSDCARVHFAGLTRRELRAGLLFPRWALGRLPYDQGEPTWDPTPSRDRWPEEGFDPGPADKWDFPRYVVADWLTGRAFKPVYDFLRHGGAFPPKTYNNPPPPTAVPDLTSRESDTLLKIIYGMATSKPYNFDPSATRSEVAPTIASAVTAAGQSIDPDTVRKYLKLAAERFGKARSAGR